MIKKGYISKEENLTLELLRAVDLNKSLTQRSLASDLGIALGLANIYIKKCVDKGFLKIKQAPRKRLFYYLTPKGFIEKANLTKDYLRYSYNFYRKVKIEFNKMIVNLEKKKIFNLVLSENSELAEIFLLASLDNEINILGIIGKMENKKTRLGVEVFEKIPRKLNYDFIIYTGDFVSKAEANKINKSFKNKIIFPEFLLKG